MGQLLTSLPQTPTIQNPYTTGTAQQATATTQGAIGAQQNTAQQQQAFLNQLAAQNGIQNQQNVFNQLQGVANGTGPNPAQAQLAQATGANVANQAALMAGQRGAGTNAGLIARQAAMQGANTQQQAAGQAATLQAQQSLGALGQLSGISGQQVGQQQGALAGLAGQQQGITGANLAQQQAQLGALANQNAVQAQQYGTASQGAVAQGQQTAGLLGGLIGGAATVGAAALAKGGEVKLASKGPKSYLARNVNPNMIYDHSTLNQPIPNMAVGGKVPAMVSPGEIYLPKTEAKAAAEGKVDPIKAGQKIPGKAPVKGDSEKNDIVPAELEEGGCVIPRSVLDSDNPHEAAARFVAEHLSKRKKSK